jgi:signal transduction histidine kinase
MVTMTILNKLHTRIMLPFMALFVAIGLGAFLVNRYYMGELIDERIAIQTDRISRLISDSQFILNPAYLSRLRRVVDCDIIIFNAEGAVTATTLGTDVLQTLERTAAPQLVFGILDADTNRGLFQRTVIVDRKSHLLTARLLKTGQNIGETMMLWVLSPMNDAEEAKSAVTRYMVIMGVCGVLVTVAIGFLIARSVTRPVSDLVAVTEEIADGRFDRTIAPPSVGELAQLTDAINRMSARLTDFEHQVAAASRLAAAGKVTAAMSHEIRNPLSSIKMLTQLLRDRPDTVAEARVLIQAMLEEITRVERIVGDLSGLMRPSELDLKPNDIQALIREIATVIAPKLEHRKISLNTSSETMAPLLTLDRDKVKQVFWNLLLNAMESMPQGGCIDICTRTVESPPEFQVVIQDEGGGLKETDLETVFAPFFTTKPEGLGLGLSTSREIMERHGGRLVLENRKSGGARAIACFPVKV